MNEGRQSAASTAYTTFKIVNGMLKIIADDFGLATCVNDGIIYLLTAGKINGAALMANGAAFDDAVSKIKSGAVSNLNIGAHLVWVEEKSLNGVKLPGNYKIFFIKYVLGLITLADIEQEARTQLDKISRSGIKPQFINSHQHLHLLPSITNIVIKLAQEYNIAYIRTVNEPINFGGGKLFRKFQLLFLRWLSRSAKIKIKTAGLQINDFFVGVVNAGNLDKSYLEYANHIANQYPNATVELGCHPGIEDEALRKKYQHWGNYHWQQEFELLKNHHHG